MVIVLTVADLIPHLIAARRPVRLALSAAGMLLLVERIARPPEFVPETMKADDLLRAMQRGQFHLAVVVDEYGGAVGVVTSAAWSPALDCGIGFAKFHEAAGLVAPLAVRSQGAEHSSELVNLPFFDADKLLPRGIAAGPHEARSR